MKTRLFRFAHAILATLCLLFSTVSFIAAETHPASAGRPNVVLIMVDDFGYECVSANGSETCQTPNVDRLAASGMRFENCHVQPLCTPTRVQLMTGRFNIRNYLQFGTLIRSETTFGNLFQKAGYKTAICGKWQLGREADAPQHFGFDESYLWQHTRRPPRYANPGLEQNSRELDFSHGEYGPELVNNFALDFIERNKEQPFFLYYPMILTHDPYQPTPDSPDYDPKAIGEKVNQRPRHFPEMTAFMDKMVGRLDDKLKSLGIREKTIVIFLGDNGTGRSFTTRFKGQDIKGGKGTTTQFGSHVPLVVSWPGTVKPGQVNANLISSVDFLPTICEVAGIPTPQNVDGVSFLPQLRGQKGQPRDWLYHWYSPRQNNNLKVTEYAFDHHYKLYRDGRLIDLAADPLEKSPLDQASLNAVATAAKMKLQAVLDSFSKARPNELEPAAKSE